LRCLECPDGQIRGHHLNWNKRLGTGQDLGRLVLLARFVHVRYVPELDVRDVMSGGGNGRSNDPSGGIACPKLTLRRKTSSQRPSHFIAID
jgi:hypothetical protein